jgi:hypothetical protein
MGIQKRCKRILKLFYRRAAKSADRRFSQEDAALRMNGRSGEAAPQRIDGRPRSAVGRSSTDFGSSQNSFMAGVTRDRIVFLAMDFSNCFHNPL